VANWKLSAGDWCHIEFLSSDAERSKRFYGDVFGWQYEDIPGADYVNVKTSEDGIEGGIGGLAQATGQAPPAPNGLFAYLLAPDMDTTLAAIERAGGTIVIPKTDVMGMGEFAHFRDPDRNLIGLWRDASSEASPATTGP
jgi:predicted enzyme related to lactoylglutathione lyase